MKTQTFGIEMKFTGVTIRYAANMVAAQLETDAEYVGWEIEEYHVKGKDGRVWILAEEPSVRPECRYEDAGRLHQIKLISPICSFDDVITIQKIVRRLRRIGITYNETTGIFLVPDIKGKTV